MSKRENSKRSSEQRVLAQPVIAVTKRIDRACVAMFTMVAVACTAPRGPVYEPDRASPLSLPQASPSVPQATMAIQDAAPERWSLRVPGSTESIAFVPIPAGRLATADVTGAREVDIGTFYLSACEITWDAYDSFVFARDREASDPAETADAFARPSKPYITMDRGYGHTGYPVISVSYRGADEFCRWLSAKTGRRFRLPTEAEWEHACRAESAGAFSFSDDAGALDEHAWYRANSGDKTHPVGQKKPNAFGLFDMHGNACEWCVGVDAKPVTRGGSFRDDRDALAASARRLPSSSWNRSDPQIPKSVWWLADGGFVGFRVVCDTSPQDSQR